MRTVLRLLLTLAHSLCVLHTPDRSARSPGKVRSGNVHINFTLELRRRATLVEREFLLAAFECECTRAWGLGMKLSRARPSTHECEASYSTLASRFRVSHTVTTHFSSEQTKERCRDRYLLSAEASSSALGTRRCPLYGVRRHPLLGVFKVLVKLEFSIRGQRNCTL